MPDSPDYYQYRLYSDRHALGDMAELAVRLGSPVASGRLGDVVWFTDMSQGVAPFTYNLSGTGSDLNIISHQSEYGGYSLTLTCGSDSSRSVTLTHKTNHYESTKHGFECHAAFLTDFNTFRISINRYDGVNRFVGLININGDSGNYEYLDSSGSMVSFGVLPDMVNSEPIWQHFKMIIDYEKREYVNFIHGNNSYNLQGLALDTQSSSTVLSTDVQVYIKGRSALNDIMLLDLLIFTVNEPI